DDQAGMPLPGGSYQLLDAESIRHVLEARGVVLRTVQVRMRFGQRLQVQDRAVAREALLHSQAEVMEKPIASVGPVSGSVEYAAIANKQPRLATPRQTLECLFERLLKRQDRSLERTNPFFLAMLHTRMTGRR